MTKPLRSILDPRFKYRNAANTDVRRTFEKHRRLARMQDHLTSTNVTPLKKVSHG